MNNDKQVYPVSDIIKRIFENINDNDLDNALKIKHVWKEILCSINNRSTDNYGVHNSIGRKLADHTKIIDLKNEILLVETDHSGWIQTLQLYNSYILRGLKKKIPTLKVKSIAYRLKGTYFQTAKDVISDNNKELSIDEKEKLKKIDAEKKLPDELKKRFEQLKHTMLDKDADEGCSKS